jgi:hypothetical protein
MDCAEMMGRQGPDKQGHATNACERDGVWQIHRKDKRRSCRQRFDYASGIQQIQGVSELRTNIE